MVGGGGFGTSKLKASVKDLTRRALLPQLTQERPAQGRAGDGMLTTYGEPPAWDAFSKVNSSVDSGIAAYLTSSK